MTPDEQEASSYKYNVARIVRLSSGNLALFEPWTNQEGIPIVHVGPDEEIMPLIPTISEIDEYLKENEDVKDNAIAGNNLLRTLGLLKPKEPINRRF